MGDRDRESGSGNQESDGYGPEGRDIREVLCMYVCVCVCACICVYSRRSFYILMLHNRHYDTV